MAKVEGNQTGNDNKKAADIAKLPDASAAWDGSKAPIYGGQTPILEMDVNTTVGPLSYIGTNPMTLNGKEVTVHIGSTPAGDPVRLPIAASFNRAMTQADPHEGDKFLVRRFEDVQKKDGIGKGQMMEIYGIRVTERAPRNS